MGRPYSTETPLGQLMAQYGLACKDIVEHLGINRRILTYYLHRERRISPNHLYLFMEFFQLSDASVLDYELVEKKEFQPSPARLYFELTTDDVDIQEILGYGNKSSSAEEGVFTTDESIAS